MKRKMYLLERIHDSKTTYGWKSGERIWADSPCKGWRVVKVAYIDQKYLLKGENTMKTTFKTIEQNINNLRRDYGEMIFRMSISHLMDVGMRNLTPELVNEAKDEIMKQDDSKMFVTNELLCDVVECAGELAKIDATYLLVYIGRNVEYDVDG